MYRSGTQTSCRLEKASTENEAAQTQSPKVSPPWLYKMGGKDEVDQCVHFISEIRGSEGGDVLRQQPSAKPGAKTPAALTVGTMQLEPGRLGTQKEKDIIHCLEL